MIRKNKTLSRCYLGAYIAAIFSTWIAPFLISRESGAAAIILVVIDSLLLAGLITSHVFKNKNMMKPFLISSAIAIGTIFIMVLVGFIIELIYTIQGQPAQYAWWVSSIGLGIMLLVIPFTLRSYYRITHPIDYSLKPEDLEEINKGK